jgi:excisionase family DNA binding protein
MEMLLTIEQAAERLQLHRDTVRKQLKRGALRGLKRGRVWRVPESALQEAQGLTLKTSPIFPPGYIAPSDATPEEKAAAIQAALRSGDARRRNAAIIQLTKSDARTVEIVTAAAAQAVENWDGPEDDLSQWRALHSKLPMFPEEAPDYLDGLYRADDAEAPTEPEAV